MPIDRLPYLIGHVQADRFGQMITHPTTGLDVRLGSYLDASTSKPQPASNRLRVSGAFTPGCPVRLAPIPGIELQRPSQPKHRRPLPLHAPTDPVIRDV